jgi:hypothetical protein
VPIPNQAYKAASMIYSSGRSQCHPGHEAEQRIHADVAPAVLVEVRIDHGLYLGKGLPVVHDKGVDFL